MAKKVFITIIGVIAVGVLAIFLVSAVKKVSVTETLNQGISKVAQTFGFNKGSESGGSDVEWGDVIVTN